MALRSRLAHFILESSTMLLTSHERRMLVMLPEIYGLQYKINWEGSPLTFINNLLKVLSEEGQETLLAFLKSLEEDFKQTGYSQGRIDEIANLHMEIASLLPDQWKAEFVLPESEPSLQ